MAKNSAVNLDITNNADGFDVTGGTTRRKLTTTGADVTLTGSGTNTYVFPSTSTTLIGTNTIMVTKKTGDQTIATTTLTDCTDMSFTVAANTDYFFEFILIHQAAATTTGLKMALAVTTATTNYIVYRSESQALNATTAAGAVDNVQLIQFQASGGTHTLTDHAAANTNYMSVVKGVISVSGTGGTLKLQFAGDAAANITAKKGSYALLWK